MIGNMPLIMLKINLKNFILKINTKLLYVQIRMVQELA